MRSFFKSQKLKFLENLIKKSFKFFIFWLVHPHALVFVIVKKLLTFEKYGDLAHYSFVNKINLAGQRQFIPNIAITTDRKRLVFNWVTTEMGLNSGGHMTIFRIISFLEKFGHSNRIYFVNSKFDNPGRLKDIIKKHYTDINSDIFIGTNNILSCDTVIATSWESAYPVYEFDACRLKLYFVQDFEPSFFELGSKYIMAENTYKMGYKCITAGPWLAKLLKEKYNLDAYYFDLAVDRNVYRPLCAVERLPNKVCFYAKVAPRRAFEIGMMALERIKEARPEIQIILFGERNYSFDLPFPCGNAGVLKFDELARLYNNSTIGLVFSLTNYSIVPQEMMACGLPVITNKGENTEIIYKHNEVCFTELFPDAIAKNVIELLDDPAKQLFYKTNGITYVEGLSWEKTARKIEKIISDLLP